jgi:hypothetical protein
LSKLICQKEKSKLYWKYFSTVERWVDFSSFGFVKGRLVCRAKPNVLKCAAGFFCRLMVALSVFRVACNGLPLCEVFRESLLSKKNLAKRVMGDSRAKATIVSHHPRSGSPMGKIVPKGDFSHLVYISHKHSLICPLLGSFVP